jgi:hypothetical protein
MSKSYVLTIGDRKNKPYMQSSSYSAVESMAAAVYPIPTFIDEMESA